MYQFKIGDTVSVTRYGSQYDGYITEIGGYRPAPNDEDYWVTIKYVNQGHAINQDGKWCASSCRLIQLARLIPAPVKPVLVEDQSDIQLMGKYRAHREIARTYYDELKKRGYKVQWRSTGQPLWGSFDETDGLMFRAVKKTETVL